MPKTKLPTMTEAIAILNTDKVEKLNLALEVKMQAYQKLSLLEQSLTNGHIVEESRILDESVITAHKEFGEFNERFKKQATKYLNKPTSPDDSIDDAYHKMEQALQQAQAREKQQNDALDRSLAEESKEVAALPKCNNIIDIKNIGTKECMNIDTISNINDEFKALREQGYSFTKQKTALKRSITDKWAEIERIKYLSQETSWNAKNQEKLLSHDDSIIGRMKFLSIKGYLSNYAGDDELSQSIDSVIKIKEPMIREFMKKVNDKHMHIIEVQQNMDEATIFDSLINEQEVSILGA